MIMGLFGGTVFPLAMGVASDAMGTEWGSSRNDSGRALSLVLYVPY